MGQTCGVESEIAAAAQRLFWVHVLRIVKVLHFANVLRQGS
jgi:hypothetical protein